MLANDSESELERMLQSVAQSWTDGAEVNWAEVRRWSEAEAGSAAPPRRVSLPTYAFDREPFWIDVPTKTDDEDSVLHNPEKTMFDDCFYICSWKRSMPPKLFAAEDLTQWKTCWLILGDRGELVSGLTARLTHLGQTVVTVIAGSRFNKLRENVYEINPQERLDYDALLSELKAADRKPDRVVHMWSVTKDAEIQSGFDSLVDCQRNGFYSLLYLAQALFSQAQARDNEIKITVISNDLHFVTGDEVFRPEKATLTGPLKVISQEMPNIDCRSIDFTFPAGETTYPQRAIDQLLRELTGKTSDRMVAYRREHRWIQSFERVRLEPAADVAALFRANGVYLITGGLGGMGLTLAERLSQIVKTKLVLTNRSGFIPKDAWQSWLAEHSEDDAVGRKIRKLQALEALGSELMICQADVADETAMQEVVRLAHQRFGEIHGVIHAAGVAGGGMIQQRAPEMIANVLAPKTKGTLVLDRLFAGKPLDFFVLCSSVASLVGGVGTVDYCAANAFLDAFAQYSRSKTGTNVLSINWDTWLDTGMAINTASEQSEEQTGMRASQAVEAFVRILSSSPLPQMVVSARDLPTLYQHYQHLKASSVLKRLEEKRMMRVAHPRPALASVYVGPRNDVEQTIADIWQQILGIENIGISDNFFELGGNSLVALQLMSRIIETFNVEPPLDKFFEAPRISDLALQIVHQLAELTDQTLLAEMLLELEQDNSQAIT